MMIKTYFENIKDEVIKQLNNSKTSIRIALAYFTDSEIFEILCVHSENGKSIEIILSDDDMNFIDSSFDFERLISSGGKCYIQNSEFKNQIHHKFAIIDDVVLITGSYNWTIKAQKNRENIVVIKENNIINEFINEFEHLKKISSENSNLLKTCKSMSSLIKNSGMTNIFSTTFADFDNIIEGFNLSEISVIAGRRAIGASSLMLNLILNITQNQQVPIGLFSLEISTNELIRRILNIGINKYFSDKKTQDNSEIKIQEWLEALPIFIDDSPSLSLGTLRRRIKQMIDKHSLKIFFIDNLDYLRISNKNISEINKFQYELNNELIVKELRILARLFNISIVLLCQLPKNVDLRSGDKRPYLSDFSGNIDNYADKVIFIHRPEKYGIKEDEEGNSTRNLAEIIIPLNKQGATGDLKLHFDNETQIFSEFKNELLEINDFSISSELNSFGDDFTDKASF